MAIDSNLGKVDEVMTALYDIHDPEIGMSIVDLDLIKAVEIGADGAPTEIKMVLTTPFCPWAGELIQTVKTKTEEVVGPPVKVTLLAERWEPPPGLFYRLEPSWPAMRIYTKKGDDGTTGLLFGGDRVSKADLRTEAYGTTDEAVSALGLARAAIGTATDRTEARLAELILRLQRELFVVGAELATARRAARSADRRRLARDRRDGRRRWRPRSTRSRTTGRAAEGVRRCPASRRPAPPSTWPGRRSRRAERRCVALWPAMAGSRTHRSLPYLNRLADLLFVMARAAEGVPAGPR